MVFLASFLAAGLYPASSHAQTSVFTQNKAKVDGYSKWFWSTEPDPVPFNDGLEQFYIGKYGIIPYTQGWINFWNSTSIDTNDFEDGEDLKKMHERWLKACTDAGGLVRDGYVPLMASVETILKDPKTTAATKASVEVFSNELTASAREITRKPTCLYVLANLEMDFDGSDFRCAQGKFLERSGPVPDGTNTGTMVTTAEQFRQKGNGSGKCGSERNPSNIQYKRSISSGEPLPNVVVDGEAEDFHEYLKERSDTACGSQGGFPVPCNVNPTLSPKAKDWEDFLKKERENLEAHKAKLQGFLTKQEGEKKTAEALALAETEKGSVVGLSLPLSDISLPSLIRRVITQILGIVGALGLAGFVYGGILYMTSGGNSERGEKGRKTLVWSTLGLVVIFSAYAIVSFILDALTK